MRHTWAQLFLSVLFVLKDRTVILANDLTITGGTMSDRSSSIKPLTPGHQQSTSEPGSAFTLKVRVVDTVNRQPLSQASVELYVNHTRTSSALTEDGEAVLVVPYQPGLPLSLGASMDGYLLTTLPWNTSRKPMFSSVTLSLFPLNQGNIWLFEDSVLITSGVALQPSVQIPRHLLPVREADLPAVRAFFTSPPLGPGIHSYLHTMGLITSTTGYSSMELSPLAAVSMQLFSLEREIHVSGPVQISLPLPDTSGLRPSDAVPAWLYNHSTGAWGPQGEGLVSRQQSGLVWTFTAPHLGYWIAALMPTNQGGGGLAISIDLLSQHTLVLAAAVGGALLLLPLLSALLWCCHRASLHPKAKRTRSRNSAVSKMDQTTSTCDFELNEVSSPDSPLCGGAAEQLAAGGSLAEPEGSASPVHRGNFDTYVEKKGPGDVCFSNHSVNHQPQGREPSQHRPDNPHSSELLSLHNMCDQTSTPLSCYEGVHLQERVVRLWNQPVAILHTPGLFHLQEQQPQSKSATLPRPGSPNTHPHSEATREDSFPPTLLQNPLLQGAGSEGPPGAPEEPRGPSSPGSLWGIYSCLPESGSLPGTLNSTRASADPALPLSLEAPGALAQLPDPSSGHPPSPRAWFVSLEGKPAAEIHHSTSDSQRRLRPADSRDTSLDSGVDMSEPNQPTNRKPVQLERDRTLVRSSQIGASAK
ncbi:protein FAM171B-like [Osmerus eperlanus]|uniref:protein FAM171B-like n=1 Tax=Osmerus eperlanus TaxID=29151 RepID=UPI002E0DF84B